MTKNDAKGENASKWLSNVLRWYQQQRPAMATGNGMPGTKNAKLKTQYEQNIPSRKKI
ncbi:MAG: hypothetical protein OXF62_05095 [Caldilineaceae bacterium]|nr:hypothetical protein [Caldilineaceae bacterium]